MSAVLRTVVGRPLALPEALLARYPELREARWRAGGLPLRVGGWLLGRRTVAGVTLGRTVWLAAPVTACITAHTTLLLHELCHVRQFGRVRAFPVRYSWQSLRYGYAANRYEREADAFAASVLAERAAVALGAPPSRDV